MVRGQVNLPTLATIRPAYLILGVGAATALLALSLVGSTMRLIGDDYCPAAGVTRYGFFRVQSEAFFGSNPYGGNRYSSNLLGSAISLFPPSFSGILTALGLVSWCLALTGMLRAVADRVSVPLGHTALMSAAAVVIFLTAYQAPDREQTFYWRSGMLPYLAPLITQTVLVTLLARADRIKGRSRGSWIVIGLWALLTGGFSETGASLQVAWVGLWLAIQFGLRDRISPRMPVHLLAALLGSLGAAALLILSPSNASRWSVMPPRLEPLAALVMTARCPASFLSGSTRGNTVPTIVTLAVFAALGSLRSMAKASTPLGASRPFWLNILGPTLIVYGLIAATCLPSVVAQAAYPGLRALLPARFLTVLWLAWVGLAAGAAFESIRPRARIPAKLGGLVAPVLLVLGGVYAVRVSFKIAQDYPRYRSWSQQWDSRDREMRMLESEGVRDLIVQEIDHPIPWVAELGPDPRDWYNQCAAGYYGVRSIKAIPPGSP